MKHFGFDSVYFEDLTGQQQELLIQHGLKPNIMRDCPDYVPVPCGCLMVMPGLDGEFHWFTCAQHLPGLEFQPGLKVGDLDQLPAPYWQSPDGQLTIYCGDSFKLLPAIGMLSNIHAFLTDPPYGIEGGKGNGNRKLMKGMYRTKGWADTAEYIRTVCVPVIDYLRMTLKRGALTPGIYNLQKYPPCDDLGHFETPASSQFGRWGHTTCQPIFYYGKDPRAGEGQSPNGIRVTEAAEKNGHPCPKPIKAWAWLLNKVALEGETVLDPFMGSGTTLVAAKTLGIKAIGIEIQREYCEIAVRRLEGI